jgi:hypothetical protein
VNVERPRRGFPAGAVCCVDGSGPVLVPEDGAGQVTAAVTDGAAGNRCADGGPDRGVSDVTLVAAGADKDGLRVLGGVGCCGHVLIIHAQLAQV